MKHLFRLVSSFALIVALIVPAAAGSAAGSLGNPGVLPPNSTPYGKSYVQWSMQWSKWVYSIPFSTNPVFDATGADCNLGQSGPVWFLAGTANGVATRSCTIPAGKAILFPIINVFVDYPCPYPFEPAPGQTLEDLLTETADFYMNPSTVPLLQVEVDGAPLQNLYNYRAISRMFTFTGDPSLTAWDPCVTGTPQPGVSDGYWIMLAPLSAGQHTLHLHGNNTYWEPDVTYNLTVKP